MLKKIYPDAHPIASAAARARVLEQAGDQLGQTHPEISRWLYDLTEQDLRIVASGASGQGDGRSMIAAVHAVIAKRNQLP